MTYKPTKKTFNLTMTKMLHWHRHANHYPPKGVCVFCSRDMDKVAEYLTSQGLKVAGHGSMWVEIAAPSMVRPGPGGPTTDEVDRLFKLVTAK